MSEQKIKIELEISIDEIRQTICEKIATDLQYRYRGKAEAILEKVDWKLISPFVQEAILKAAAESLFKK
jgi:hypothetical protein